MNVFGMITSRESAEYTPWALRSFFANTPMGAADRFLLIDNAGAAGGGGADVLPPRVEVIRNATPLGFATNLNLAMRVAAESRADLFFLNNDIIFTPQWIDPLLIQERAIISPVSNQLYQHSCGGLVCRQTMDLKDYLGHDAELQAIAQHQRLTESGYMPYPFIAFFCVKIPHAVYSLVGMMDESFGRCGGEDADYCVRCHLAEIPLVTAMQSFVLHFGGKSTWRGVETGKETAAREAEYRRAFEQKWGEELLRLLLVDVRGVLNRHPSIQEAYARGDFRAVVESLKRGE